RFKLWVVGGTLPLQSAQTNRVYNTTLVFNPLGDNTARYDKIHLFRFQRGKEAYDEGKVLLAGTRPVKTSVNGLQVGLSTCYDLRFPELYRAMLPLDLIVVPAAFTYTTGKVHWELLLKARAVENQCYVLGCGQGGTHRSGRRTWGQSMIIDPWGEVLAQKETEGPGIVLAQLSSHRMTEIREQLPALSHRVLPGVPPASLA
ncbi:MAG: carbon-nitrogen hydrolase family protein, partial [Limnobacter sp.]|nr:carbon-nitrogen hydrolase family protein [Limnobacter sp.]